jgi:hypothetical protein
MRNNIAITLTRFITLSTMLGAALASSAASSVPNFLTCNHTTILGSENLTCTVQISPIPTAKVTVDLKSNKAALVLPSSVTVPANTHFVQFSATVSSVVTAEEAKLTASTSAGSTSYTLNLQAATRILVVTTGPVAFPNEVVNTNSASIPVTMHSSGSLPVTVKASVTGSAFSIVDTALPMTVAPYSNATIYVRFSPTKAAEVSGVLTITNNGTGSSGLSASVPMTGLGTAVGAFPGSQVSNIVLPTSDAPPYVASDFFGMTIYNLAPNAPSVTSGLTPFPSFPVSTLRLWDVAYWAGIEPTKGWFNWTKLDGTVATGQQNDVADFIFNFGQPPKWASSDPTDPCTGGEGPGTCDPPIMSDYEAFITTVVQRYCGKIKYYEPWNEPNSYLFWVGTNAQMLSMAKEVYQIAKNPANCGCTNGKCSPGGGANPNQVLLPPVAALTSASVSWLNDYLASAGSTPYADIAAFHGYVFSGFPPETIVSQIQSLKQVLDDNGLGNLQLWNTETSWGENANYTQQEQASWLMRSHMADVAAGVSRLVWYAYDSCSWGTLPVPTSSTSPCVSDKMAPAGVAYGTVESWLREANFTQCQEYFDGLWACELQRGGGYDAWMLWSTTATSLSVSIPKALDLTVYRDWQNKLHTLPTTLTITQTPVLLETVDDIKL